MTNSQLDAFKSPKNVSKRLSLKKRILSKAKTLNAFTIRELAKSMGETYKRIQPRVSELTSQGKFIEGQKKKEGEDNNTVFYFNHGVGVQKPTKTDYLLSLIKKYAPESFQVIYYEFISRK